MQTKNDQVHTENKGGFFPCCPSWFNQSYWEIGLEKNLEDIWNGKAAIELRKRMYEGDFTLCNRNECKIPLMSIDELSNPEINFIETPISPENIEAIRQKNPVMPEEPSSLHLVADLRCNLKCPTCRPEVVSNTTESIEAEEEYELVHKLKDNVEIIKMSSSGEVFYSQTQRRLLKSFNKEDFPKLRRVHIVSNGTLFNEKAYRDLLPGTSYIKDVSISLDAGTKEVYEKLRGPYWEQVVSNLEWLGQMREEGKFEYLTINFTLIRDNYRDIPNLVALGKRIKVDRILIQKYNFARNQGYKTHEEQKAQAIHEPEHPEHIHMLRTLEIFKDEPLVHALIEIEGFGQKIEDKHRIRKALVETPKIIPLVEDGKYFEALTLISEVFGEEPLDSSYLTVARNNFEYGLLNINNIPLVRLNTTAGGIVDELRLKLFATLIDYIYNFRREDKFIDGINTFVLLYHFFKNPPTEIIYSVANNLKDLNRFNDSLDFVHKAIEQGKDVIPRENLKDMHFDLYALNLQMGFIYTKLKDLETAIVYYKEALKFEPAERKGEVVKYLDEAIKYNNENHYTFNRSKGFEYQQKKFYALAIESFEKALNYGMGDPDMFFSLGISYKRQMKYLQAKSFFTMALEGRPDHYYALMEFGVIELLEGRRKSALDLFLRAQSIEPEGRKAFGEKMIKLARRKTAFGRPVES